MKASLRKIIGFSDKQDRIVFWLFWVLFSLSGPVWIAENFFAAGVDDLRYPFHWAFLVGPIFVGIPVWKLLKCDRISAIRNVVLGVQGLILFASISFVCWLGSMGLFGLISDFDRRFSFLAIIPFVVFILPGLFFGGCWLGFKIRSMLTLIIIWSIIIVGLLFRANFGIFGLRIVVALAPALIGAYLGGSHLTYMEEAV